MTRIPIHFPRLTQHLFWLPPFTCPPSTMYSVEIQQRPYWWSPDVCRHDIFLADDEHVTSNPTSTYSGWIDAGTGSHGCPADLYDRILNHLHDALLVAGAPRDPPSPGPFPDAIRFTLDKQYELDRSFAASVEDLVRRLAPDFTATMVEVNYIKPTAEVDEPA